MIITRRRQSYRRPTWPFGIDLSSWQANGLLAWWPRLPFGGDQTPGRIYTLSDLNGTVSALHDDEFGEGATFDGTDDAIYAVTPPVTARPLTLCAWAESRSTTASQNAMSVCRFDGSVQQFGLSFGGAVAGDPIRAVVQSGGVNQVAVTSTGYVANRVYHGAAVFTADANAVYINGTGKGTVASTTAPVGIDRVILGGVFSAVTVAADFNGIIYDARVYNRALSDAEIWALYDPRSRWDLYDLPTRRVYVDMAGAAPAAVDYFAPSYPSQIEHPRLRTSGMTPPCTQGPEQLV